MITAAKNVANCVPGDVKQNETELLTRVLAPLKATDECKKKSSDLQ